MSEAVTGPPVLALDRTVVQAWAQAAVAVAEVVREHRATLGLPAWSARDRAARAHDVLERLAAAPPELSRMSPAEHRGWTPGPGTYVRSGDGAQTLRVRLGPCGARRWGVAATLHTASGGQPSALTELAVSCVDEQRARELAHELISHGPEALELDRLGGSVDKLVAQHTEATSAVAEPAHRRDDRTATALRQAWDPSLAQAVLDSPAFAHRLHQLEQRGYALPDVLARIPARRLRGPDVRDPGALAAWIAEKLTTTLLVIEGNLATGPAAHAPAATGAYATATATTASAEVVWDAALAEDAVWPWLRSALPAPLCQALRASRSYDQLLAQLGDMASCGWSLQALLARLPIQQIAAANNPAGYLSVVVANRAKQTGPARTGLDRTAIAELARAVLPTQVADKLTGCLAWPSLAATLARAQAQGLPVGQLLGEIPAGLIADARKPAAYTATVIAQHLNTRRGTGSDPAPGPAPDTGHLAQAQPRRPRAVNATLDISVDPTAPARLDPASSIDQIAIPAQDADAAPAAPSQTAAQINGGGELAERGAGHEHRSAPIDGDGADPAVSTHAAERHDTPQIDDNVAAGYRASAAEHCDAPIAAALRATAALTPPTATPSRASTPSRKARPVRTPVNNPSPDRARRR